MRQASTESSAAIYKGTATGDGVRYITRSCFAFCSIGVGLQQHADQTRVTVLALSTDLTKTREQRAYHFSEVLEPYWLATLTPEYVDRLHARAVSLIPVIRKNAQTFAVAGATIIGTRRMGDQLGALLAGAYSLHSSREITLEEARTWLAKQDWTDEAQLTEQRDEVSCLQHLLQHVVGVMTERNGRQERSLGDLVQRVGGGGVVDMLIDAGTASETLKRHGLRVEGENLFVANSHSALARVLFNTPWAKNWRLILKRMPGAAASGPMRFGGSAPERAVSIPLAVVFGDQTPEGVAANG
jgi:putative DNA primase/helicase